MEALYKVTLELEFKHRDKKTIIQLTVRAKDEFDAADKAAYSLIEVYGDEIIDGEIEDIEKIEPSHDD
jgi:hypothetical protein